MFSRWLFLSKKILSIDIGTYETKIVEGKRNKRCINVSNFFSFLTPEGAYENGYILEGELLYYILKEEMKKNKVSSKIAYITIKSTSIIRKEIKLPILSSKEIEGVLSYQMNEYLPIDIENFIIQYKLINKEEVDGLEKLNILLIAIPKEIVESHFSLLKDLAIEPVVLDYQPNSICKLFSYNDIINNCYKIKNTPFAVIDLGFFSTNIAVIKNDSLLLNHTIKTGIKDDENYLISRNIESLMDQIESIFKYYKSEYQEDDIQFIVLYGGYSNIEGIEDRFSNFFEIPSVKINKLDRIFSNGDLSKYMNSIGAIVRNGEKWNARFKFF